MTLLINNFQFEVDGEISYLRLVSSDDHIALLELYRSTRQDLLMLPLESGVIEGLIQQQREFQLAGINQHYPQAITVVLERRQAVVASMIVDLGKDDLRLIDIAVLPMLQGRGIARALLQYLQNEASIRQTSLSLRVSKDNPKARRLYASIGMQVVSEDQLSQQLQWRSKLD